MPKVELHVHLEGSIRPDTAVSLARRHGEDPDDVLELEDGRYPRRYTDFLHFVRTFLATSRQVRTAADLRAAAAAFARQQADQHVVYTEATLTAVTHVRNGIPVDAVWEAVAAGLAEEPGTDVRLIVDTVRDLGTEHAHETVDAVERGLDVAPIVGLGLSGVEGSHPEGAFTVLREAADGLGLGLAVHAGETGTADNVRAALDDLGADRIGHGVAVLEDPALVERVAAAGVPFEVCPSSNVRLAIVDDIAVHPVGAMLDAGVAVVVGSDDPPFFDTTLTEELAHVARLGDLDRSGLATLQRRAATAAFCGGDTRDRLHAAIGAWGAE